jgi:phosphoribosylanthranilate isomerase
MTRIRVALAARADAGGFVEVKSKRYVKRSQIITLLS